MSLVNHAALRAVKWNQTALDDDLTSGPASTQSLAVRLKAEISRCTASVANGSFILPSIATGEANGALLVFINDSANTVLIYPASGENQNGSANATLSVAAGRTAILIPATPDLFAQYGDTGTPDWRSAAIA